MALTWVSNTDASPAADQVIVDTGAVAQDAVEFFTIVANASLAASFLLQHRNSANTTTLHEQELNILANEAVTFGQFSIFMANGERIRIVMRSATLGRVSCSLFWGQSQT